MGQRNAAIRWLGAALAAAAIVPASLARADSLAQATPVSAIQLAAGDAAIENPASLPGKSTLMPRDEEFLNDLEKRGIQFFVDYADPVTGLMPDRGKTDGSAPGDIASIASIGFGLSGALRRR